MQKQIFILTLILVLVFGCVVLVFSGEKETIWHGGDIIYTKPVKAVLFSHKAHTEDIGLKCNWCHESTFEMQALRMQEEADFTMESLCNERYCGTCHNGDISFSTTTQCARCHIGVKGYKALVQQGKVKPGKDEEDTSRDEALKRLEDSSLESQKTETNGVDKMVKEGNYPEDLVMETPGAVITAQFSHRKHTERERLRCVDCHPKVFIMKVGKDVYKEGQLTMAQMEKGKYCGTCHNGKKAFSVTSDKHCVKCHSKQ